MPDNLNDLMSILLLVAPFLFVAVVFLGFVGLLGGAAFFLYALSNKVTQDLSKSSDEHFAEVAPQLLSWDTMAPADFSAYLECSSRARWGSVRARGKVKSISRPDAVGWLAFDMHIAKLKGAMMLRSAKCDWKLQFLGLTAHETPIEADGAPLGSSSRGSGGKRIIIDNSQLPTPVGMAAKIEAAKIERAICCTPSGVIFE